MNKCDFRKLDRGKDYYFRPNLIEGKGKGPVIGKVEYFFKDGVVLIIRKKKVTKVSQYRSYCPCEMITLVENGEELWRELEL